MSSSLYFFLGMAGFNMIDNVLNNEKRLSSTAIEDSLQSV
jgi:hypothetical protein